jgi:hypothetical protein
MGKGRNSVRLLPGYRPGINVWAELFGNDF